MARRAWKEKHRFISKRRGLKNYCGRVCDYVITNTGLRGGTIIYQPVIIVIIYRIKLGKAADGCKV